VEEKPKGNGTLEAKLNGVLTPVTTVYNRSGPKKIGFASEPSINFKNHFFKLLKTITDAATLTGFAAVLG